MRAGAAVGPGRSSPDAHLDVWEALTPIQRAIWARVKMVTRYSTRWVDRGSSAATRAVLPAGAVTRDVRPEGAVMLCDVAGLPYVVLVRRPSIFREDCARDEVLADAVLLVAAFFADMTRFYPRFFVG